MDIGALFNLILLQPMLNYLVLVLKVLQFLHIPGALGFSIILITISVSLITWPFRASQIRNTKRTSDKMAELKPQFDKLEEKFKGDKLGFNQAKAALLKEHGINPAAGCLPSIIPILFIFPLYQVFFALFNGDKGLERINYFIYNKSWHVDRLPDTHFFGLNLANKPSEFGHYGMLLLLIPLITGALTFIQSKMMAPSKPLSHHKDESPKELKEKEKTEDAMTAMQSQMSFMMPLMIGFFAYQFPVGLAVYWNTLTILGIVQQYMVAGWGGMEPYLKKLGLQKR